MKSLSRNIPRHGTLFITLSTRIEEREAAYIFGLLPLSQGVKFWNPIMVAAFSGSLFLFFRAFLPPGVHNYHLALTKYYQADSTLLVNLSTAKPGAHKASLPIWTLVDNIKNETYMSSIFLESDSLQLGGSQVVAQESLERNNLMDRGINRSFSSRFLSNPPRRRPRSSYSNQNSVVDKNIDNIYDSEPRHVFDPGYDPLELEPFFSLEESGDGRQIFALKIWLNPKDLSRAEIGKVETCQASRGVKCW
jgi:hypothetical protein